MAKQLERLKEAGMHWAVLVPFMDGECIVAAFFIHCAAVDFANDYWHDGARVIEL